jgi:hypothetical protein
VMLFGGSRAALIALPHRSAACTRTLAIAHAALAGAASLRTHAALVAALAAALAAHAALTASLSAGSRIVVTALRDGKSHRQGKNSENTKHCFHKLSSFLKPHLLLKIQPQGTSAARRGVGTGTLICGCDLCHLVNKSPVRSAIGETLYTL